MATVGKRKRITQSLPGPKRLKSAVTGETTAEYAARHPASPKAKTTAVGARHTIVCVRQDDGRFAARVAEAPEIRFIGKTRAQAERVVSKMYTDMRGRQEPHNEQEDRLWIELARANRETQGIAPSEYRRQRGHS